MMSWIEVGLLLWMLASVAVALLVGRLVRRCDVLELTRSVESLRSKAQGASNQAA